VRLLLANSVELGGGLLFSRYLNKNVSLSGSLEFGTSTMVSTGDADIEIVIQVYGPPREVDCFRRCCNLLFYDEKNDDFGWEEVDLNWWKFTPYKPVIYGEPWTLSWDFNGSETRAIRHENGVLEFSFVTFGDFPEDHLRGVASVFPSLSMYCEARYFDDEQYGMGWINPPENAHGFTVIRFPRGVKPVPHPLDVAALDPAHLERIEHLIGRAKEGPS